MAAKRKRIPRYSSVEIGGQRYYRTFYEDAEGKSIAFYGKTREELYNKEMTALEHVDKHYQRQEVSDGTGVL